MILDFVGNCIDRERSCVQGTSDLREVLIGLGQLDMKISPLRPTSRTWTVELLLQIAA